MLRFVEQATIPPNWKRLRALTKKCIIADETHFRCNTNINKKHNNKCLHFLFALQSKGVINRFNWLSDCLNCGGWHDLSNNIINGIDGPRIKVNHELKRMKSTVSQENMVSNSFPWGGRESSSRMKRRDPGEEVARSLHCIWSLEWFSNDCRKTKTKATTPTNHNRSSQRDEPITIPSNHL